MPETDKIRQYLNRVAEDVDKHMLAHLPAQEGYAQQHIDAMRYSITAGGKRIRPAMALTAYRIFGGREDTIYLATSALEMIHTFSLIHDDLPCMDNDDFRRGKPTSHKVFGEATAVLAGDALCIHAFQLLAMARNPVCIEILAQALGTKGMLGGQMEDILAEGRQVDVDVVNYIHMHKTAALIEASLLIGAQLASAPESDILPLSQYGKKIGLAFQIVDDILDVEQTTESLGKDAGSDIQKAKATYPAVAGLEESKRKARMLMDEAVAHLRLLNKDTRILEELAEFIVNRVN